MQIVDKSSTPLVVFRDDSLDRVFPASDPHSRPEMAASPSAPTSKARLYALLAALAGYAAVGWCVLAIVKAVVGDPLTNYLLSTHNNAMLVVSSAAHCPPTTRAYTKLF